MTAGTNYDRPPAPTSTAGTNYDRPPAPTSTAGTNYDRPPAPKLSDDASIQLDDASI